MHGQLWLLGTSFSVMTVSKQAQREPNGNQIRKIEWNGESKCVQKAKETQDECQMEKSLRRQNTKKPVGDNAKEGEQCWTPSQPTQIEKCIIHSQWLPLDDLDLYNEKLYVKGLAVTVFIKTSRCYFTCFVFIPRLDIRQKEMLGSLTKSENGRLQQHY